MSTPPLTPLAVAVLHVGRPERILAVDCGKGDGALFLAREFPQARVRGVDRDPEAIRAASARIGLDPEGRVAFKVGGRRTLPFPDDLFDLVVVDTPVPVGELARVLRPGGHLIVVHADSDLTRHGLRARLRARRLATRFEPVESGEAGNGSFAVSRLRGGRSRRDAE